MLTKRLEDGKLVWPSADTMGRLALTAPQLAALLDGCEWRAPAGLAHAGVGGIKVRAANRNCWRQFGGGVQNREHLFAGCEVRPVDWS